MGLRFSVIAESTSLHGFKHLTNDHKDGRGRFKRIFWTTVLALSLLLMLRMLRNMLHKQSTSTAITVDTAYLDFENVFPGISVCLAKGRGTEKIKEIVGDRFLEMKLTVKHYRSMQGYAFMNYLDPTEGINREHCSDLNDTCGIDFNQVRETLAPKRCEDIIAKMLFLGREVRCEDFFDRMVTEIGICFVANSLYSPGVGGEVSLDDFSKLRLRYSNKDNVERSVELHYRDNKIQNFKLLIHTPEELPDGRMPALHLRKVGKMEYTALNIVEFHNRPGVKDESIESRKCRFPSERFDQFRIPFSLNYCRFLKRAVWELERCNCTLPTVIGSHMDGVRVCTVTEFGCPSDLAKEWKENMKVKSKMLEMMGDCLVPTCISMEITKLGEYDKTISSKEVGVLKIEILNKPTLRYIRQVSFTRLDMMVQVGGIVGLFFGASFISILELFYLIYRMIQIGRENMRAQ